MKQTKIFIAFTFLLAFAGCVSAQNDSIPTNVNFADLLKIGPKKVEGLELGDSSPNELSAYKFLTSGKLKKMKLGISTKEDVVEAFGENCIKDCEYSNGWRVFFTYFDNITKSITENKQIINYIPDPKFTNKLYSIKLVPEKRISFTDIVFPNAFYKFSNVAFGHDFDGNATHVAFDLYTDSYGLRYTIFDKIDFKTKREKDKRQKGDLISIEYEIPRQIEEKLFIEQK